MRHPLSGKGICVRILLITYIYDMKKKQIALTKERESKMSRIYFVTGAAGSLENNTCLQMIAKGDYPKAGFEFAYSKNFVTWYAGKYVFDYGKKESVSSPSLRG